MMRMTKIETKQLDKEGNAEEFEIHKMSPEEGKEHLKKMKKTIRGNPDLIGTKF